MSTELRRSKLLPRVAHLLAAQGAALKVLRRRVRPDMSAAEVAALMDREIAGIEARLSMNAATRQVIAFPVGSPMEPQA